ncbi:aminomethyltransferase [Constrictibacter sp. MBR-5]|uniref:glycine cleavage system aminomethyltransferase GcvT n=1 Tax=Constrictibacter sp. MBR-5 TaxID=3156467 RepID=UPI00339ACDBE
MSQSPDATNAAPLKTTPLDALHRELGGKMVPFAGYDMPVQYPAGIVKEHLHTRAKASLFDVSHMGQVRLPGDAAVAALEALVPGDLQALKPMRMRYTMFTDDKAGILDDLMVTRVEDGLFVVVNAACKEADIAHMRAGLPKGVSVEYLDDRALLALQGPAAVDVMARLAGEAVRTMPFMSAADIDVGGFACFVTRSGYTGEDGFEISVASADADAFARRLLAEAEVEPAGLGARDSLRLEAGLCLYGHDIDTTTSPIEAGLVWTISKRRREAGGFPGAAVIQDQLANGVTRKRVGIRPEGRVVAREHTAIVDAGGSPIGEITSGGFGPSAGGPVGMGYVATDSAQVGMDVSLLVRGAPRPAQVAAMPFVPHGYFKGK